MHLIVYISNSATWVISRVVVSQTTCVRKSFLAYDANVSFDATMRCNVIVVV